MVSSTLSNTFQINLQICWINMIKIHDVSSTCIMDQVLKFMCHAILKIELFYIKTNLNSYILINLRYTILT